MKLPIPRFSLKWLLIIVAVSAGLMWAATQLGMVTAHFEIKKNKLRREGNSVVGQLEYRYSRPQPNMAPETIYFVCSITNLPQPDLLDLKEGDKWKLRFRLYDVGPFKKQNVSEMFLTDKLGFDQDDIQGYVEYENYVQVVINGSD